MPFFDLKIVKERQKEFEDELCEGWRISGIFVHAILRHLIHYIHSKSSAGDPGQTCGVARIILSGLVFTSDLQSLVSVYRYNTKLHLGSGLLLKLGQPCFSPFFKFLFIFKLSTKSWLTLTWSVGLTDRYQNKKGNVEVVKVRTHKILNVDNPVFVGSCYDDRRL